MMEERLPISARFDPEQQKTWKERDAARRQERINNALYLVQVSHDRGEDPAKLVMRMPELLEIVKTQLETPNRWGVTGAQMHFVVEQVNFVESPESRPTE